MKLALVQMQCEKGEIARNLAHIEAFVERAANAGANIACFPEMSITGYVDPLAHARAVVEWTDDGLAAHARALATDRHDVGRGDRGA